MIGENRDCPGSSQSHRNGFIDEVVPVYYIHINRLLKVFDRPIGCDGAGDLPPMRPSISFVLNQGDIGMHVWKRRDLVTIAGDQKYLVT